MSSPINLEEIIEEAKAILGEHFEHYVIIVNTDKHECQIEYDNSFAAKGLLDIGTKTVDNYLQLDFTDDADIIWDEDESDSDDFS